MLKIKIDIDSDKSRRWNGLFQLFIVVFLFVSAISSWPDIWNLGTLTVYGIAQCLIARYYGKKSIKVNYTLFNSLWVQWGGYKITPQVDYSRYQAYQVDVNFNSVDMQYERITEWTQKHISSLWIKKFNSYYFLKKKDAVAFKLVWG